MTRALFIALISLAIPPLAFAWDQGEFCDLVVKHTPEESASYQPGVDVHGNPVVPADLNAVPIEIPEVIIYPNVIDLAQWFGGSLPTGSKMEAETTMVEIYSSGKVVMDGKDITEDSVSLCSKIRLEKNDIPVIIPEQDKETVPEIVDDEMISGEGH